MKTTTEGLEALLERQQGMEDHALALGGQRFKRRLEQAMVNGTEAQVGAARKLLVEGLVRIEEALKSLCEPKTTESKNRSESSKSRARVGHRPHAAVKWIKLLGYDVAAYLALKVVLDNIHGRISVRKAAYQVAELIVDELRFRRFKEVEPKLFQYAMTGFTTSSYAHKARSLDARIHHAEVDVSDLQMDQRARFLIGVKLLDVVITVTQLVTVEKSKVREAGSNSARVELVATEETLKWLSERNGALEHLWPVNLPMVMPPLPWAQGRRGGYRFALRGKHRVVRSNSKAHRELVEKTGMPAVYSALNRIQGTPWSINRRVLEVIEGIISKGGGFAGIPEMNDEPLPVKPIDIDTNEVSRKQWRRAASLVHEKNHEARIKRSELFRLLSIVNLVKDEGAIWFPHNLDFRGRVYPVVNHLHPQGDDVTKGLLQFAQGKPVGKDGIAYLALHGASSLGKSLQGVKLSHLPLQERVEYIYGISGLILDVARDPLSNTWWMEADDKWQFLAFCFDWAGFVAYEQEGRGDQYISALPVAMDGTCNGLQHFAALWLDPVGGEAVNVMPTERPHDIYQRIADVVLDRLEQESATEALAVQWLTSGIVDRKLTKRPTMTFGYGSQRFGFAQQLREYVESHEDWREKLKQHFMRDNNGEQLSTIHAATTYMAQLIWDALEVVAVSAFRGMEWMRSCAKTISKGTNKCVEWSVPGTGFPVRQGYMQQQVLRTETMLAGSAFRPRIFEETLKSDWKKQTSSVAPNIVHSLDAAALMLTVNHSAESGIEHFAMVHDSYGTLAADAPLLATMTRQAFHMLYATHDVVSTLWDQFMKQSEDAEIAAPPPKGSMDIGGVLLSDYFFS